MELKVSKEKREELRRAYRKHASAYGMYREHIDMELLDDMETLETELSSAREALKEIGAYGNAAARLWLNDHPEPEPEGKKE